MRRREHPNLVWIAEHLTLLYIALVVTVILAMLVFGTAR